MKKYVKFQNDDFDYGYDFDYNHESSDSDSYQYQNDWQQNDSSFDDDLLAELSSLDTYKDGTY